MEVIVIENIISLIVNELYKNKSQLITNNFLVQISWTSFKDDLKS